MNLNRYNQLYDYLESDKLPEEFTDYEKKQLINKLNILKSDITSCIKRIEKMQNTPFELLNGQN